jgi:FkbM family methyltransferase
MALIEKIAPLIAKARGCAPLCPWLAAVRCLYPCNFKLRPPKMDIFKTHEEHDLILLCFAGKHSFWFPRQTRINLELWNEYLAVFWDHPANAHRYLTNRITVVEGDVVYDCGACEGFFTQLALDSSAARVVCIEPSGFMAECLRRTFATAIAQGRVVVCEAAVSSAEGRALFEQQPGEAFTGKLTGSGSETVELTTLDALAGRLGPPTLIKMDLEGLEYEALRGGVTTLAERHPKLAITTYHYPWDYVATKALIASMGYNRIRCSAATMRQTGIPRVVMLHACTSTHGT